MGIHNVFAMDKLNKSQGSLLIYGIYAYILIGNSLLNATISAQVGCDCRFERTQSLKKYKNIWGRGKKVRKGAEREKKRDRNIVAGTIQHGCSFWFCSLCVIH